MKKTFSTMIAAGIAASLFMPPADARPKKQSMKALVSADRPVVRIWHPDDPKQYVELQFENQQAADNAVEHLHRALKQATGMEFGEDE
jgi:DNA-binding LacI/PurR family transcriptional regulator